MCVCERESESLFFYFFIFFGVLFILFWRSRCTELGLGIGGAGGEAMVLPG